MDDFAVYLLTMLGYVPRARMARTRADIPLTICGQQCHAKTDVCVVDHNDILLLVQEDKRKDPEPQLIAEAIAAFQTQDGSEADVSRCSKVRLAPTGKRSGSYKQTRMKHRDMGTCGKD